MNGVEVEYHKWCIKNNKHVDFDTFKNHKNLMTRIHNAYVDFHKRKCLAELYLINMKEPIKIFKELIDEIPEIINKEKVLLSYKRYLLKRNYKVI